MALDETPGKGIDTPPAAVIELAASLYEEMQSEIPGSVTGDFTRHTGEVLPLVLLGKSALSIVTGDDGEGLTHEEWCTMAAASLKKLTDDDSRVEEIIEYLEMGGSRGNVGQQYDLENLLALREEASRTGRISTRNLPQGTPIRVESFKTGTLYDGIDLRGGPLEKVERVTIVRPYAKGSLWLHIMDDRERSILGRLKDTGHTGEIRGVGTYVGGERNYVEDEIRRGTNMCLTSALDLKDDTYAEMWIDEDTQIGQAYFGTDRRYPLFDN